MLTFPSFFKGNGETCTKGELFYSLFPVLLKCWLVVARVDNPKKNVVHLHEIKLQLMTEIWQDSASWSQAEIKHIFILEKKKPFSNYKILIYSSWKIRNQ